MMCFLTRAQQYPPAVARDACEKYLYYKVYDWGERGRN